MGDSVGGGSKNQLPNLLPSQVRKLSVYKEKCEGSFYAIRTYNKFCFEYIRCARQTSVSAVVVSAKERMLGSMFNIISVFVPHAK